ncbi:MAG: F0F1 ATP synthase subunit alpha [Oscillospiraceae bacterium]|jgi:F-type H+-transporting ATPase subunit alpha|nr:F0F1 ATP synthase subunit alpha [Oscillospiraceae bacterium]
MERPILIVASKQDIKLIESVREGFERKIGANLDFEVVENEKITGGFIAIVEGKVYDASFSSKLDEFSRHMLEPGAPEEKAESAFASVSSLLKDWNKTSDTGPLIYEYGVVQSLSDDIIRVNGLSNCHSGELLSFDGGAVGLTLDLHLGGVDVALLSGKVSMASLVHATGRIAEICVGDDLLGRVVNPLGRPLDGRELRSHRYRPIESPAPTIMQRAPVSTPLETGILTIDSMIPIGRGQRELIIGDRQTGKTSIALSAIMNQRDKDVVCVYCAIGQKATTVAGIAHTLEKAGALDYTAIVAAFGSDTAAMQYIAPYAACAIAEEFMYNGRDTLVVYDDLSKHAVAYRAMSLLLRRPSGREAYPGDVFYLHSRLLERAAKLSPDLGGGSMTALPIVETLVGDISAYIPTNVISITDGQIYLETEMFNAGQRPAINVGLSVSRVGRAAQHKAMRDVSVNLRLDVAQYREIAVFAQFGADIDSATAAQLRRGERLMKLFIQAAGRNYRLSEQAALLLAASSGFFENFEPHDMPQIIPGLLSYLTENGASIIRSIDTTGKLSESDKFDLARLFDLFIADIAMG